jgi:hypothetical protein
MLDTTCQTAQSRVDLQLLAASVLAGAPAR